MITLVFPLGIFVHFPFLLNLSFVSFYFCPISSLSPSFPLSLPLSLSHYISLPYVFSPCFSLLYPSFLALHLPPPVYFLPCLPLRPSFLPFVILPCPSLPLPHPHPVFPSIHFIKEISYKKIFEGDGEPRAMLWERVMGEKKVIPEKGTKTSSFSFTCSTVHRKTQRTELT